MGSKITREQALEIAARRAAKNPGLGMAGPREALSLAELRA